jgi:hypothetical protein
MPVTSTGMNNPATACPTPVVKDCPVTDTLAVPVSVVVP